MYVVDLLKGVDVSVGALTNVQTMHVHVGTYKCVCICLVLLLLPLVPLVFHMSVVHVFLFSSSFNYFISFFRR